MSLWLFDIDHRIFRILNGLAGKSGATDFIFIFFAEYILYLLIAGFVILVSLRAHRFQHAREAIVALASAFIARAIFIPLIQIFYFRIRPFGVASVTQLIPHNIVEASFPSGHATVMFALACSLLFTNKRWGALYFFLAFLSSTARVIVGVHFPLDIAAGILVGVLSAFLMKMLSDYWFLRKQKTAARLR